jgi:hypothetical protein
VAFHAPSLRFVPASARGRRNPGGGALRPAVSLSVGHAIRGVIDEGKPSRFGSSGLAAERTFHCPARARERDRPWDRQNGKALRENDLPSDEDSRKGPRGSILAFCVRQIVCHEAITLPNLRLSGAGLAEVRLADPRGPGPREPTRRDPGRGGPRPEGGPGAPHPAAFRGGIFTAENREARKRRKRKREGGRSAGRTAQKKGARTLIRAPLGNHLR